ncbi:MAG: hypothetical protein FWH20_07350 [Oscillospiraceae bacterium]|nr:hypothetical protein [Oscillospiraceae bacterium]
MRKIAVLLITAMLLTSCGNDNNNTVASSTEGDDGVVGVDEVVVEITAPPANQPQIEIKEPTPPSTNLIFGEITVEEMKESILKSFNINLEQGEIFLLNPGWQLYKTTFFLWEFIDEFYRLPGSVRLISEEELDVWRGGYNIVVIHGLPGVKFVFGDNHAIMGFIVNEAHIFVGVDLDESPNMYTFSRDYNLSAEQIRDIIEDEKTYYPEGFSPVPPIEYTDEQIEALVSMDKERIVRAFARDTTIVKGDKFYSLLWFYLAPVEAYRENNMTEDDLMIVLKAYEERAELNGIDEHTGHYEYYVFPFALDFLREKIDEFLRN